MCLSFFQNGSGAIASQDFHGHRWLTLTSEPVVFSTQSVSRGPTSDYVVFVNVSFRYRNR